MRYSLCLAVLAAMLSGSCGVEVQAVSQVQAETLPVKASLTYASGSALSGPVPMDINSLQVEESYALHVQLLALADIPITLLDPMYDHIRLVIMSPKSNILSPVIRLTPGARVQTADVNDRLVTELTSEVWGRGAVVTEVQGVLPPNVTAHVTVESQAEADQRGHYLRVLVARRSGVDPNHPGEFLELGIIRTGRVPSIERPLTPSQGSWDELAAAFDEVTERVLLQSVPIELPHRAALVVPFAWKDDWAQALVLVISLEAPPATPDSKWMDTFAGCVQGLLNQEAASRAIHGRSHTWAGCMQSLDELVRSVFWRNALVHIATTTQAMFARDLALSAPDYVARSLALSIYDLHGQQASTTMEQLRWSLEKSAYQLVLDTDNEELLLPELRMLLLRHAGQSGRQLPTLREQLTEAKTLEDFQRRLVHENRISLEDMSPAARARAFEWLQLRGLAPKGYDPLASAQDRRAAMRQLQEEEKLDP